MRKKVNLKRTLKILGTGVLGPPNFRVRESQGLSKFWSLGNTVFLHDRWPECFWVAVESRRWPRRLWEGWAGEGRKGQAPGGSDSAPAK